MAEKRVIELEVQTNDKSLKAQLREAQQEVAKLSEKFGATSEQAIKAAKRAAELKDAIADAADLTKSFNPDAKFDALSRSIGGALNGFQAFEGALGLVGVESEDLQKTLLKVQSAMAVSQGLQGLMEAKDSFAQLGAVASNALKEIKTGLLATGIGIFVVVLGTIVSYWDDISKAVNNANEEQEKYNQQQQRAIKDTNEMRESVSKESAEFVGYLSQLKATNAGSKERSNLITEINKKYGTTLKNLSDEAEFQSQLNAEIKNYLEYQKAKFTLQKNEERIAENLRNQDIITTKLNNQKRRQLEIEKELLKSRKALNSASTFTSETKIYSDYDKLQKKINSLTEEYNNGKKSISEYGNSLKAAENRLETYGASSLKAQDKINTLTYNGKKYVEQTNEITKNEIDKIEKVEKKEIELLELKNKSILEASNYKLEQDKKDAILQEEINKDKLDAYQKYLDSIKEKDEKEKERKKLLAFAIAQTTADGLRLIASIAESTAGDDLKRQKNAFQIRKASNLAQATIDGTKAVLSTYADTPGGPILKSIAAAIAGGFSALQIANIAKAKFESPTTQIVNQSSAGGGGITAPSFNVIGSSGVNQLAQIQQQPTRAYVVSGDIANGLSLERNRLQNASF